MTRRIALMSVVGALVAAIAAGALAAATRGHTSAQAAKVITVKMTEYHFTFSPRPPLKKGVVYTIKETNTGQAPHNIDIQGIKAGPIIGPGKSATFKVTFKKAGRFPYLCDVPRHAELGMRGLLVVR